MNGILVDSNILLDVFLDDPKWGTWPEEQLYTYGASHHLYINPIIYPEISIGFSRIEDLEQILMEVGFIILPIPKEALFLAGKNLSPVSKTERNETIASSGFLHWSSCGNRGPAVAHARPRTLSHLFPACGHLGAINIPQWGAGGSSVRAASSVAPGGQKVESAIDSF